MPPAQRRVPLMSSPWDPILAVLASRTTEGMGLRIYFPIVARGNNPVAPFTVVPEDAYLGREESPRLFPQAGKSFGFLYSSPKLHFIRIGPRKIDVLRHGQPDSVGA